MLKFRLYLKAFFHERAVVPLTVGHGLLAGGVVGDGGHVALSGEVHVTARPRVVEAVYPASVVLEKVADTVVGIVGRFGF